MCLHRLTRRWTRAIAGDLVAPVEESPVTIEVAFASRPLASKHQDPVDRFLAATAQVFDLTLVTADRQLFRLPGVRVLKNVPGPGRRPRRPGGRSPQQVRAPRWRGTIGTHDGFPLVVDGARTVRTSAAGRSPRSPLVMTPDTLFTLCNLLVLPGWGLLLVAPSWKWTARLIGWGIIPLTLALVYLLLIALNLAGAEGGFGSLEEVAGLFSNRWLLLAGWVHYLAFDLLVGSWEVLDARREGVPHGLVVPCLILTFLLGPIGFLLYAVVRGVRTGRPTWEIA